MPKPRGPRVTPSPRDAFRSRDRNTRKRVFRDERPKLHTKAVDPDLERMKAEFHERGGEVQRPSHMRRLDDGNLLIEAKLTDITASTKATILRLESNDGNWKSEIRSRKAFTKDLEIGETYQFKIKITKRHQYFLLEQPTKIADDPSGSTPNLSDRPKDPSSGP